MSYNIEIVTANGRPEVIAYSDEIPDGKHVISGHVVHPGQTGEHNLALIRQATDGHILARCGSAHTVHHHGGGHALDSRSPGQRAYEAYSEHANGLSIRGEELPAWDDQDDEIRHHWHAAAAALLA